jgi:hypothetical protein
MLRCLRNHARLRRLVVSPYDSRRSHSSHVPTRRGGLRQYRQATQQRWRTADRGERGEAARFLLVRALVGVIVVLAIVLFGRKVWII